MAAFIWILGISCVALSVVAFLCLQLLRKKNKRVVRRNKMNYSLKLRYSCMINENTVYREVELLSHVVKYI